jgi:hypothetical protein
MLYYKLILPAQKVCEKKYKYFDNISSNGIQGTSSFYVSTVNPAQNLSSFGKIYFSWI